VKQNNYFSHKLDKNRARLVKAYQCTVYFSNAVVHKK